MKHLFLLLWLTVIAESFLLPFATKRPIAILSCSANNHDDDDNDNDNDNNDETIPRRIPQLPAATTSSSSKRATSFASTAVVSTKLELQYTCQICDTRNVHQVSRIAYRQGVVIVRCRGCSSQHWIADHQLGGFTDIETYLQQQQQQGTSGGVHRVSRQVFDLEQVWNVDTSSGSLMGENGERNLE